jgi:Spy/CpxP family protein refolding chaperone
MTKTTAFLFAASLMFTATACDPGEDPVTSERAADADADADVAAPDEVRGHHGHRGKRGDHAKFAAEKLCGEIDCSDDQAAKIQELFASRHQVRDPELREAHKAAREQAHKAIADAFRAEDFDPAVLEQVRPEHHGDHQARMIELAVELHALLTPEQRAALAETIEQRGPMFFGPGHHGKRGKRGHHGKRGKRGKWGPQGERGEGERGDRLARKVDHLCEKVSCTEEQETQLRATFEGVKEAHHEARENREKPDFSGIAALFRAETLDADALAKQLEAAKAKHEARRSEHGQEMGAVVAEIHDILTPEQRAIVADAIEAEGIHVLMGGKRHGKHGKHGKRGGPGEVAAE